MQRLEAVLLLAREPLASRKIAQLAQLEDGTQARTLIRKLNTLYDNAGRAFRVEELAGGYQLLTRQKFASWITRLGHVPSDNRLSTPALETLAVVAYRQPVLKADIEAIRGVNSGEILRQLMERDLVRISGRSEELGRPYLYTTTKRFLQQFGMRSLEELPRAEILRTAALPPVGKAAANGHHTANPELDDSITRPRSPVDKESDVSVTLSAKAGKAQPGTAMLELEEKLARRSSLVPDVRLDDDDDFEEEEDADDDDDDLDDEDEDDEDEEDDELDEDEWEEVEDEDDLEDEDDEDWDDEDDEEWDEEDDEDLDDDEDDDDDDEEEEWEEAEEA